MLTLVIPMGEAFDDDKQEFIPIDETTLHLEHSLVSLSKWEIEFEKPFLETGDKTSEEILSYINYMILDTEFPPEVFSHFTKEHMDAINAYITAPMTATWFQEEQKKAGLPETITNELIYYWMVALTIPFECQYWHLNRLLTLIRVCNIKNEPPKELSPAELAARNRALNEQRKRELGTSG